MKVLLSKSGKNVLFIPDPLNPPERKALAKFPGTLHDKEAHLHFAPAKPNIVYNLINRMKKKFGSVLKISPDVQAMLDGEFKLKKIPESFKFYTTPLRHQEVALRYFYTVGGGGMLLDPGLGKTKVVLDGVALMGFKKSLIVCPKALLFVWQDEVAKHRPDKSVYVIESTAWDARIRTTQKKAFNHDKERAKIEEEAKWPVEERLKVLEERFNKAQAKKVENLKKQRDKDRRKAAEADIVVVNYDKVVTGAHYLDKLGFDFIAVDEGLIKDPKTERTKAVTYLGASIPYRCIMSGTLVNNTPLDIFAPVRFLEPTLTGRSYVNFRDRYSNVITPDRKNPNKIFIKGFRDTNEVRGILESCSIVMTKDEWLDLPPKKFHPVYCPMSEEQARHFNSIASNYITKLNNGEFLEVDSPLTAMCKLGQISNGFMYRYHEPEDLIELDGGEKEPRKRKVSDRETIFFEEQSKIKEFKKLFEETLHKRKFIMWYNLSAERKLIEKALDEMEVSYLTIAGGEKDTGGKVHLFNNSVDHQVLLCQARAVNYGITVLGMSPEALDADDVNIPPEFDLRVHTQVFYSLNYSLELYLQQQDRCHRIGQEHPCDYFLLLADNEYDRGILDKLDVKMSIRGEILVDIFHKIKGG